MRDQPIWVKAEVQVSFVEGGKTFSITVGEEKPFFGDSTQAARERALMVEGFKAECLELFSRKRAASPAASTPLPVQPRPEPKVDPEAERQWAMNKQRAEELTQQLATKLAAKRPPPAPEGTLEQARAELAHQAPGAEPPLTKADKKRDAKLEKLLTAPR